jgi:hypothetical protein
MYSTDEVWQKWPGKWKLYHDAPANLAIPLVRNNTPLILHPLYSLDSAPGDFFISQNEKHPKGKVISQVKDHPKLDVIKVLYMGKGFLNYLDG